MRRPLGFLIIAILIVLGICLAHREAPKPLQRTVEQQNAAVVAALAAQNTNTVAIIQSNFVQVATPPAQIVSGTAAQLAPAPAGPATPPELATIPPETAVENMSRMIKQYGQMFGGNPVGNNQEFAKQLGGANPKHINFISADAGMRVNASGELVDPWGTPYFFHQISGSDTEVRSAGPDKVMYTTDDIVVQ